MATVALLCRGNGVTMSWQRHYYAVATALLCRGNGVTMPWQRRYYAVAVATVSLCRGNGCPLQGATATEVQWEWLSDGGVAAALAAHQAVAWIAFEEIRTLGEGAGSNNGAMVPLQMLLQCKQGSDRVSNLQNTISGDATARQAKKEYYLRWSDGVGKYYEATAK